MAGIKVALTDNNKVPWIFDFMTIDKSGWHADESMIIETSWTDPDINRWQVRHFQSNAPFMKLTRPADKGVH
jgi:hypothetical protein